MRSTPFRLLASAAAVALTALTLSGCAPRGSVDGCSPEVSAGQASGAVTTEGAFGKAPSVRFAMPLHTTTTQATTVIAGRGAPVGSAQEIVADVTLINATTGATITSTGYSGSTGGVAFVVGKSGIPGLSKALVCAQPGERRTAVIPPTAGIPAASRGDALGPNDSIVAVVDVRKAFLARADGADQVMAGGLPAVVLGPDGRPGVTLPEGSPPKTLQVADLKAGSGAVLHRNDTAVLHYTAVAWKPGDPADNTVLDSTWPKSAPTTAKLAKGQQLVPGLVTALVGRRVGSQVLAVIPPSLAFGSAGSSVAPPNATVVYVVDILGKA